MKKYINTILVALIATIAAVAQPAPNLSVAPSEPVTFVKGEVSINYATRRNADDKGKPREGYTDKYSLSVNVSNSALFRGTIEHQPYVGKTLGTSQSAQLTYSIDTDVVNPKNPAQTRNVGKIYGVSPITKNNVYMFADGSTKITVFPLGQAKGFDSNFRGTVVGRPNSTASSDEGGMFAKLKKEALNITKLVNGKAVTIPVTKYDKMEFQDHILPAGPVQIYPEVKVNGSLVYDYGRSAWYFDGVTVVYAVDGRQYQDKLSGNIRWVESPTRATTGEGQYEFDIRVNEPVQSEASVFSGPADESAFFSTDEAIPALTGLMKYKDTLVNETVMSSAITVDLKGNKLSKQQMMYLTKLLFLTSVVPLNAE
jgi:hypothetical protein